MSGTVRGRLADPEIVASLEGNGFTAGALYFPDVSATAAGPVSRLAVSTHLSGPSTPKFTLSATVARAAAGTDLRDVEVVAQRDDLAISGKVKSVAVADDKIELAGLELAGAGAAVTGSISVAPGLVRVRASTTGLDLKKLAAVVMPGVPVSGRLAFDVDTELEAKNERGHARFELADASFAGVSGVSAQGEGDVDGRRFSGGVEIRLSDLGALTARTVEAELAGPLLRASSWKGAAGKLQVDAQTDLQRVAKLVQLAGVQTGGTAFARLILSREELDAHQKHAPTATDSPPPDLDLLLWTDHLHVETAKLGKTAIDGVDAQIGLHLEGEGTHDELNARLIDGSGLLAGLTVLGTVRMEDLWANPARLGDKLMALPISAKLNVPRRGVDTYPPFMRPLDLRGDVEATGTLGGSLHAPSLVVALRGYGIEPASVGAFPVDVESQVTYDGRTASTRVRAKRPEGVVLDAVADVTAPIDDLLGPHPGSAWQASGSAKVDSFPLGTLVALAGSQVGGLASGSLTFRGLNREPDVQAQVEFNDLKVDRATFPHAVSFLRIAKGGALASARLDQASGGASVSANAHVKWTSPIVPEVDTTQPLDVYIDARDLRAAALYPLLFKGIFTHFDGRLGGTLHLHQERATSEIAQTVDGAFDLKDGVFQISALGQEFRNATAKIQATKQGEVDVSQVSANGTTGRLAASGKMMMKGLSFVSAEGDVRIAKNEAVPLTMQGVSLGEAWGTLMLHVKMADDHTVKLDVDVPTLHTDLPGSSGRDLQSLNDDPGIRVGMRSAGQLAPVALGPSQQKRADDALVWKVTFYLGQDVVLKRGPNLELTVAGEPVVELTDEVRVTGQVDFPSGRLEVFGKRFQIEHGSAKFESEDASNPDVAVTAVWEAPDGTRVFADFVGPLRTAVPKLRSEPPHPESELMSILLYGTDDASGPGTDAPAVQDKDARNASGVLGGAVAMEFNQVLSRVTPLDITTRVSNDAQNPTPEVAVQLTPKLSAQVSYRSHPANPAQNNDPVLVTLDWRFRRNWSVATTLGKQTSIVDLLWQYRY